MLAGDVANLAEFDRYNDFWDWCSGNFKETVVIPGNHDYYRLWLDEDTISEPINYAIRKNVHCCNNVVFQLEDVDLICSTLWSELNPRYERALCSMLPDFQAIFLEGRQIGSKDYCRMHKTALSFLKTAVEASTSRHIVVATHHLPSNAVVADCFKNSVLNSGFVTELGPWIASSSIDFWIYGHSHISIETEIGKTKILSNQLLKTQNINRFASSFAFLIEANKRSVFDKFRGNGRTQNQ